MAWPDSSSRPAARPPGAARLRARTGRQPRRARRGRRPARRDTIWSSFPRRSPATSVSPARTSRRTPNRWTGPSSSASDSSASSTGAAWLAGMFEAADDPARPMNTLVLADGDELTSYRKIHLYDSFGYRESDTISAGVVEPCPIKVRGFPVGLMTCYDLRFPELARTLVEQGAEALVVPAAWVAGDRKVEHWRTLLRARAIENTVWVIGVGQPAPRYSGHTMVVAPDGDIVVEADGDEAVLEAVLDRRGGRRRTAHQPVAVQPPRSDRRTGSVSEGLGIVPGVPTVENVPGRRTAAAPSGPSALRERPASARDQLAGRRLAGDEQQPPPRTGAKKSAALQWAWVLALLVVAVGLSVLQSRRRAGRRPPVAGGRARRPARHRTGRPRWRIADRARPARRGGRCCCRGRPSGRHCWREPPWQRRCSQRAWPCSATRPAATFLAVDPRGRAGPAAGHARRAGGRQLLGATWRSSGSATSSSASRSWRRWRWSTGSPEACTAWVAEDSCWPPGATVLLLVVLVYTAALTRYGSPELVLQVRSAQEWVRDQLGGVPHPVEVLVGIPALVVGGVDAFPASPGMVGLRVRRHRDSGRHTPARSLTDVFTMEAVARGGVHAGARPAARLRADPPGAAAHRTLQPPYGGRGAAVLRAVRNPAA